MVGAASLAGAGGTLVPAYKHSDQWLRANEMKRYHQSGHGFYTAQGEADLKEQARHYEEAEKHKKNWRTMNDQPIPLDRGARADRSKYINREWDRAEDASWRGNNAGERARFHFSAAADDAAKAAQQEARRKMFKGKTLTTLAGTAALGGLAAQQFSQAHKNKQRAR